MAYKHLNTDELTFIESYYHQNLSVKEIAKRLKRSIQTIYNVINALKTGITALEYYKEYKQRKSNCGRHRIVLPENRWAIKHYWKYKGSSLVSNNNIIKAIKFFHIFVFETNISLNTSS